MARGKANNLIGKKFGKLLVLSRGNSDKTGNLFWVCKCDCGNTKEVRGSSLLHKRPTESCGCIKKLPPGENAFNTVYGEYTRSAKERGYSWELTKEQFKILTKQDCSLCGVTPSTIKSGYGFNGSYVYNGIDRINNDIGYTLYNCQPMCRKCNFLKGISTTEELLSHINDIVLYQGIKNRLPDRGGVV